VDAFDDGEIKVLLELANDLAFGLTILRTRAERQRAEEKLRAAHEQIRALAARLAEVEEEERRRLAGELHDRVGQNLTALGINLDILQMQSPTEREAKVDEVLWDSQLLVKKAMEDIRNVMSELRPPVLDEFGLLAALRWYVGEFSKRTELTTVVEGEEMVPRLPPEMDIALFRIAQEALTNAAKHSRASRVTVTLEKAASRVILTVADDGVGFDPRAPRQKGETMGWGLILMRERAENIGGNLKIESSPGKGTRVVVAIRS
jgi:two-component system sensor histidine kinase UhpB